MKSVLQLHMKIEEPREAIIRKSVNVIYEHIKYYLELSSLFFLGIANSQTQMDVSSERRKAGIR